MSSEGKLTLFGVGKESTIVGMIPVHKVENNSNMGSLTNLVIDGGSGSNEEIEDLSLDQGENRKRKRGAGQITEALNKDSDMSDCDATIDGLDLSHADGGFSNVDVFNSKNVLAAGLGAKAYRQP